MNLQQELLDPLMVLPTMISTDGSVDILHGTVKVVSRGVY